MDTTFDHLDTAWAHLTQQLTRATADRRHPFRLVTLGTVAGFGANLRTVVLRCFNASPFVLTCYTDARSQKITELEAHPTLTWLFWHPRHQLQVKAIGRVHLDQGTPRCQHLWDNMHLGAKATYLAASAPGTPQPQPTNGLPSDFETRPATDLLPTHFTIIDCAVDTVEWLRLDGLNHRRARYECDASGQWSGTWVTP